MPYPRTTNFNELGQLPTTLGGYGIVDGVTATALTMAIAAIPATPVPAPFVGTAGTAAGSVTLTGQPTLPRSRRSSTP
ncbi:MAG: hypothetical protein ABSA13_10390 [Beijerinckiaceae bacterium]